MWLTEITGENESVLMKSPLTYYYNRDMADKATYAALRDASEETRLAAPKTSQSKVEPAASAPSTVTVETGTTKVGAVHTAANAATECATNTPLSTNAPETTPADQTEPLLDAAAIPNSRRRKSNTEIDAETLQADIKLDTFLKTKQWQDAPIDEASYDEAWIISFLRDARSPHLMTLSGGLQPTTFFRWALKILARTDEYKNLKYWARYGYEQTQRLEVLPTTLLSAAGRLLHSHLRRQALIPTLDKSGNIVLDASGLITLGSMI